jgi:hypothetical protein
MVEKRGCIDIPTPDIVVVADGATLSYIGGSPHFT